MENGKSTDERLNEMMEMLTRMDARGKRQDEKLEEHGNRLEEHGDKLESLTEQGDKLEQWTSMPDDYKLSRDLPPGASPRTIKVVVYRAIFDVASRKNIVIAATTAAAVFSFLNQIIKFFGGGS